MTPFDKITDEPRPHWSLIDPDDWTQADHDAWFAEMSRHYFDNTGTGNRDAIERERAK